MLLDFQSLSIWLNLAIFSVAAAIIWQAGSRLARYSDIISERTGIQQDFIGMLLLALATSLPELATTVTAAAMGNASLAVNNLIGGIAFQTAVLAIADIVIRDRALTYLTTRPALLLQASSLIVLLALTLGGSITGEIGSLAGVGIWPVLIFACYLLAIYVEYQQRDQSNWTPASQPERPAGSDTARKDTQQEYSGKATNVIVGFFVVGGVLILAAGFMLARIADTLAVQTGLGAGFVGATLLAASTSLPEVSATIGAVRIGDNDIAISNVFGSHLLLLAFIVVADIFYRGGPVMNVVASTERFAWTMAIAMTAIYLIGMIERQNRTVLRMGFDSIAVLFLYTGTIVGLYVIG